MLKSDLQMEARQVDIFRVAMITRQGNDLQPDVDSNLPYLVTENAP